MASQTNNPQPQTPRLDTFQDFLSGIAAQNQQVLLRGNPEKVIRRIKAQILGTLRAAELPGCYLRKPVSLLDIRQYCEALNDDPELWAKAIGELLADGRISTLYRNGHLLPSLRSPLPPDYEGDAGDETEPICGIPFNEQEQVSGERATSQATAETDVSAEGPQRHRTLSEGMSVPSLPAHSTANGTESRYVDPELRAKTSPVVTIQERAKLFRKSMRDFDLGLSVFELLKKIPGNPDRPPHDCIEEFFPGTQTCALCGAEYVKEGAL